jgi:flagellar hook assembly protein FlgD
MRLSEGGMSFRIEAPASEAIVLRIYDSSGRLVATPASGVSGVSEVRWDGRTADGTRAQSGVYFYSVQSGGRTSGGRLVVLP